MVRRLVVGLTVPRDPQVTFEGDHITKVELEVVIRGIRKAYKKTIVEYRRQRIIAKYKADKKKEEVEKDGANEQSKRKSNGSGDSTNDANRGGDAKASSADAGDNSTAKSGQGASGGKSGSDAGSSSAGASK